MMGSPVRSWIRRLLPKALLRFYDAAIGSNSIWRGKGGGRGQAWSLPRLDDELAQSLPTLIARCRHAFQNSPTARAIVEAKVALIVSTGIDIEPTPGIERDAAALRSAWLMLVECADASGRSNLYEMQRQAWRQIETAGSFIWIIVDLDDPNRPLPFALHAIEPDLLSPVPVEPIAEGNTFALGIERDRYAKPIRYHFDETAASQMTSPLGGSLLPGSGGLPRGISASAPTTRMVLPADRVIHGYRILRPSQSTGEPGLAPILNTLHQERRLVEAELTAALNGAACSVAIVSKGGGGRGLSDGSTGTDGNGNAEFRLEPGTIFTLDEGESTEVIQNNRPSQAIAPFRLMLCGDEAGATGVPQRMINRDVSRANYSSMRADQLDTKRIIDPETAWFGRLVAREVYLRAFAQLAVLAMVYIPPRRSLAYRLATACEVQTDGWAYVDPQKDVAGAIDAIRAGLSTFRDERSSRGKDARDLQKRLEAELKNPLLAQIFNDTPTTPAPAQANPPKPAPATDPTESV